MPPAGTYDLSLNLPDKYTSLNTKPLYSVRLAKKQRVITN